MIFLEYLALIFACATAILCLTQISRLQQRVDQVNKMTDNDQHMTKLMVLYDNIEGLMDSFETYVEEVRQELEREREHITELSRQAAVLYAQQPVYTHTTPPPAQALPEEAADSANPSEKAKPPAPPKPKRSSLLSESDIRKLEGMPAKQQKVRYLLSRGMELQDIARELNIGKGEVRLIANLDKT